MKLSKEKQKKRKLWADQLRIKDPKLEPCIKCGNPGAHYFPVSMGDEGFFACEEFTENK